MVYQRTFERCELVGPTPVLFSGSEFSGCQWLLPHDNSFIFIPNPENPSTWPPGTVFFRDCILKKCVLQDFRVVGSRELLDGLRDAFSLPRGDKS